MCCVDGNKEPDISGFQSHLEEIWIWFIAKVGDYV